MAYHWLQNNDNTEDLVVDVKDVNIYITDKPCSTCTRPLWMTDCEDFCSEFQSWLDKQ
jgi:hypothetical protein